MREHAEGMSVDEITAVTLRARATGSNNGAVAKHVSNVKASCAAAADQGYLAVDIEWVGGRAGTIPYVLRDAIKSALEADGFKVSFYSGDQRDPGSGMRVAW